MSLYSKGLSPVPDDVVPMHKRDRRGRSQPKGGTS